MGFIQEVADIFGPNARAIELLTEDPKPPTGVIQRTVVRDSATGRYYPCPLRANPVSGSAFFTPTNRDDLLRDEGIDPARAFETIRLMGSDDRDHLIRQAMR